MSGNQDARVWRRPNPTGGPPSSSGGSGGPSSQRPDRQDRGSGRDTPTTPTGGRRGWDSGKASPAPTPAGAAGSPLPGTQAGGDAGESGGGMGRHVGGGGFDGAAVREWFAGRYKEALAGQADAYMKVKGDSVPKRSSGVWSKNNVDASKTATGQSFWTQLRLQVQKIEEENRAKKA